MKGKKPIYLDYAAATPLDPAVLKAMQPYLGARFYNPSSLYLAAREVKKEVELARSKIAQVLGAKPNEIIFTSGATESANLAIMGIARRYPGSKIVAAGTEHHAVLNCLEELKKQGYELELIPVSATGKVDVSKLTKAITANTVLVSVAYANNETGAIQPIHQISKEIEFTRSLRNSKLPLYFHTDASAAANYLSMAVDRLGIDLLSFGGGKIYGPGGSGLLYIRRGIEVEPLIYGGGQEGGIRSGTIAPALVVGLAEALSLANASRSSESNRLRQLRDKTLAELKSIEGVEINGDPKTSLPNFINLSVRGVEGESLVLYLDQAGIQVSTGAACTIGQAEPSHVLLAMGLTKDQANSNLRITLGRQTAESDIRYLIAELPKAIKRLRQIG